MVKQIKPIKKAKNPTNLLDVVEELIEEVNRKSSWKGTQQNLYSYARMGWEFYAGQLVPFGLYRAAFTADTGTDALDFITATEAMASFEALKGDYVLARKDLIEVLSTVLHGWQMLKGYCKNAYPASTLNTMLTSAGSANYSPASDYSWDHAATLIRMAKKFMTDNLATLTADLNMPATFPASFTTWGDAFTAQREVFKAKEETARTGIELKFKANEQIYRDFVTMMDAGKVIFKKQRSIYRNFVIGNLYKEVRGNSPSGIVGEIMTGENPALPVANALIYDQANPERSATTDAEGKYDLKLPKGKYTLIIEAPGYVTQTIVKNITLGTTSSLKINLVPAPILLTEEAQSPIAPSKGETNMLKAAVKQMGNGVGG